jgi:cytochrome c biogenesis protein CcmG, thiol:disulfide interchange protein DsbE
VTTENTEPKAKPRRLAVFLPLVLFLALAGVFLAQLLSGRDASVVPSALIGAEAPVTSLPPLEGLDLPGFESAAFEGQVTLVNVWASWCAPCRQEHPMLMRLAEDERVRIVGLNYKDTAANARRFLGELGNPFDAVGVDGNGRAAIDWGVYGVPESFVVGRDGRIVYKHVGPFSVQSFQEAVVPAIEAALADGG